MRLVAAALAMFLAGTSTLEAGVEIHVAEGHVSLRAEATPVFEVLDRLARQTRMKVIYDGPPPRELVTVVIKGRTPPEAVLEILEGLGLNYVVGMDPAGTRVDTLIIVGAASVALDRSDAKRFVRDATPLEHVAPPDSPLEPEVQDQEETAQEELPGEGHPLHARVLEPRGAPAAEGPASPILTPSSAPQPPGFPSTPFAVPATVPVFPAQGPPPLPRPGHSPVDVIPAPPPKEAKPEK